MEFLPHGTCFLWQPEVLWLTVSSDAAIALAYYSIPISLFMLLRKRRDASFSTVIGLFGLFIVLCGTTHVVDIIDIWHPIYLFGAWLNIATAAVSVVTAVAMVRALPGLLRLPSPMADMLTGLPNRTRLLERLDRAVDRARRTREPFAVLFVDLDHFKAVNDTLGHGTGDALLSAVAERLRRSVREHDTVARYGGDEFVILLERGISRTAAGEVAHRMIAALEAPFSIFEHDVVIGASIGGVVSDGETRPLDIIAQADRAMYEVKLDHRGGVNLTSTGAPVPVSVSG